MMRPAMRRWGCSSTGERWRGEPQVRVRLPPISTIPSVGTLAQQQSAWLWTRRDRGSTGTPSQTSAGREVRRAPATRLRRGRYPRGCPLHLNNRRATKYDVVGAACGSAAARPTIAEINGGDCQSRNWVPLLTESRRASGAGVQIVYPPPLREGCRLE